MLLLFLGSLGTKCSQIYISSNNNNNNKQSSSWSQLPSSILSLRYKLMEWDFVLKSAKIIISDSIAEPSLVLLLLLLMSWNLTWNCLVHWNLCLFSLARIGSSISWVWRSVVHKICRQTNLRFYARDSRLAATA